MPLIKQIHKPEYAPISDLVTYRALPTRTVNYIDPFLFLNHHGPQVYPAGNRGLPFGPHPHRGMETVTLILDGDISHKDSSGHESVITAGGVQWMTAGKGLIHAEVSSDHFKKHGGPLEILQLWVNLPAKLKMTAPFYRGLQKESIPTHTVDNGKVSVQLISGEWNGDKAAFEPATNIHLQLIAFEPDGQLSLIVPADHHIFFYIIRGSLKVNDQVVSKLSLVEFTSDNDPLRVNAVESSLLLFGHAKPFNEPVVSGGPFVMNTEKEIEQAYEDYNKGLFGTWKQ